jgi:hypothetical protein
MKESARSAYVDLAYYVRAQAATRQVMMPGTGRLATLPGEDRFLEERLKTLYEAITALDTGELAYAALTASINKIGGRVLAAFLVRIKGEREREESCRHPVPIAVFGCGPGGPGAASVPRGWRIRCEACGALWKVEVGETADGLVFTFARAREGGL